jgi:hypothetical protein
MPEIYEYPTASFDPSRRILYTNESPDIVRLSGIFLRNVEVSFSEDRRVMFIEGERPVFNLIGYREGVRYEESFGPEDPLPVKWKIETPNFFRSLFGKPPRRYVSEWYETVKRERYSAEVTNFMIVF